MPSPPSTRPRDARGRRSFAFAREDSGRIRGFEQRSALQAGNILPVREFRFWPTCEVPETTGDFRFLRCCGLILLIARLSHFDPELPSAALGFAMHSLRLHRPCRSTRFMEYLR